MERFNKTHDRLLMGSRVAVCVTKEREREEVREMEEEGLLSCWGTERKKGRRKEEKRERRGVRVREEKREKKKRKMRGVREGVYQDRGRKREKGKERDKVAMCHFVIS
jgi:hypothetical protein